MQIYFVYIYKYIYKMIKFFFFKKKKKKKKKKKN